MLWCRGIGHVPFFLRKAGCARLRGRVALRARRAWRAAPYQAKVLVEGCRVVECMSQLNGVAHCPPRKVLVERRGLSEPAPNEACMRRVAKVRGLAEEGMNTHQEPRQLA